MNYLKNQSFTRFALIAIGALVIVYIIEFVLILKEKDLPQDLGEALVEIGAPLIEGMNAQGGPRMRLVRVDGGRKQCNFILGEAIWGRCAKIFLDVMDYRESDQQIVRARSEKLLSAIQEPCASLDTKGPSAAERLRLMLGCGGSIRPYRAILVVRSVSARAGQGLFDPKNPYWWNVVNHQILLTYHRRGEI